MKKSPQFAGDFLFFQNYGTSPRMTQNTFGAFELLPDDKSYQHLVKRDLVPWIYKSHGLFANLIMFY